MRRQYRIATQTNWQSMFGQALLAITNVSGSGRKLTLKSLELSVRSIAGSASPSANATLWQCTTASGESMNGNSVRMDSATSMPSGVVVRRNGGGNAYTARLRSIVALRSGAGAGTQNTLNNQVSWGRFGGLYKSELKGIGAVEPIVVPNGTAVVLMSDTVNASAPFRVHATASVNGKTVIWEYVTATQPGLSLFSLENTAGATVKLLRIGIQEVGTTDTPYLRLVPVGQVYGTDFGDTSKQIQAQITPMDSTYPSISGVCKIYQDVGFVPYGVPENYMTDTTAGTPRGFNYLHTKDFNGPVLRIAFPEMECVKPGGATEDMIGHGYGHVNSDIGVMKSDITINPGEGLAIVASAETAVAVQAAFSGWTSLHFAAQINEEPQFAPYLNLTGLIAGSDVVVLYPGSTTVIDTADSISGTTYSLAYDTDIYTVVDLCVYRSGSKPLAIRNLNLGTAGATVPISQIADGNYI